MKKPCRILLYLIIAGVSVGILLRSADILNVFYFQNKGLKIERTGENEYRAKAGFESIDLSIKRDSLHYYQVILHRFSNLDRIFDRFDVSFTKENNTYTLTDAYNYDAKVWWVFWVKKRHYFYVGVK